MLSLAQKKHAPPILQRTVIPTSAWPAGMCWVPEKRALFIADSRRHELLVWFDGWGFDMSLPVFGKEANGLLWGDVAHAADGSFYITQLGSDGDGGIIQVPPDGKPTYLDGLDPSHRRIGLLCLDDGYLLSTFYRSRNGRREGGVSLVHEAEGETVLVYGLKKPVGLARAGNLIYVSDQENDAIMRFELGQHPRVERFASISRPDHICVGPDETLFVASQNGDLYRVSKAGHVDIIEVGLGWPRGIACDPTGGWVFLIARENRRDRHGLLLALPV